MAGGVRLNNRRGDLVWMAERAKQQVSPQMEFLFAFAIATALVLVSEAMSPGVSLPELERVEAAAARHPRSRGRAG